jgi:RNA-directed DNA polymerase
LTEKRALRLIRAYLNAGVMENGLVSPTGEGTPQGGPLSPLLSNLVLDDLDKELEKRGHRFARYADDCNIYVASERAGQRVMASIKKFITGKLKLKVNEAKSAVAEPKRRKFLGFTLRRKRHIAPQSLKRFKQRVRELTVRQGMSLEEEVRILSAYLRGWRQYYSFCQTPTVLERLDHWVRRRLRCSAWRRWRTGRTKYACLKRLGVPRSVAKTVVGSNAGPWRASKTIAMHTAFPDAYFDTLGLVRLSVRHST